MAQKAHRVTDVWAGASRAFKGYTQKHTPLLWEMMLGTVYAKRENEEAVYFDYDYEAAHAHIQLDKYEDLRVCRVKYGYQGWPQTGKWALFGVPKVSQRELRVRLENAEAVVAAGGVTDAWRRRALRELVAMQLKQFDKRG